MTSEQAWAAGARRAASLKNPPANLHTQMLTECGDTREYWAGLLDVDGRLSWFEKPIYKRSTGVRKGVKRVPTFSWYAPPKALAAFVRWLYEHSRVDRRSVLYKQCKKGHLMIQGETARELALFLWAAQPGSANAAIVAEFGSWGTKKLFQDRRIRQIISPQSVALPLRSVARDEWLKLLTEVVNGWGSQTNTYIT